MASNNTLHLGVAAIDITPEEPMQLVGMGRGFIARDGECFEYGAR